jgi:hypothetical protein
MLLRHPNLDFWAFCSSLGSDDDFLVVMILLPLTELWRSCCAKTNLLANPLAIGLNKPVHLE